MCTSRLKVRKKRRIQVINFKKCRAKQVLYDHLHKRNELLMSIFLIIVCGLYTVLENNLLGPAY